MSLTKTDYINEIKRKLKFTKSGVLTDPDDYENALDEAVKELSKIFPYIKVVELTGDGNSYFDVPSDWEDGFSEIYNIEYPINEYPPQFLDENYYYIEDTPTGKRVRFTNYYPGNSEKFWFRYTIQHQISDSQNTVPDIFFGPLTNLACAFVCFKLANYYSNTADPTLTADVINYGSKGEDMENRGKNFKALWEEEIKGYQNSGYIGEWDMKNYWNTLSLSRNDRLV